MITKIVPKSVFVNTTDSLDKTWADRLSKLRIEELLVDSPEHQIPTDLALRVARHAV